MKGEDGSIQGMPAYAESPADGRTFFILPQLFKPLKGKIKGCKLTPDGEKVKGFSAILLVSQKVNLKEFT